MAGRVAKKVAPPPPRKAVAKKAAPAPARTPRAVRAQAAATPTVRLAELQTRYDALLQQHEQLKVDVANKVNELTNRHGWCEAAREGMKEVGIPFPTNDVELIVKIKWADINVNPNEFTEAEDIFRNIDGVDIWDLELDGSGPERIDVVSAVIGSKVLQIR